jgi:hypothetical protein
VSALDDWNYKPPLTHVGVYEGSKYPLDWRIYPPDNGPPDEQRSNPESLVVMRGCKRVIRIKAMGFNGPKYSFAEELGARYLRRLYYRLRRAGFPEVTTVAFPASRTCPPEDWFLPSHFYRLTDVLATALGRREWLHPNSVKHLGPSLDCYNHGPYIESDNVLILGSRLRSAVGFTSPCDVWGSELPEKMRDNYSALPLLNYLVIGDPTNQCWLLIRDRPERTWAEREVAEALLTNARGIGWLSGQLERHAP